MPRITKRSKAKKSSAARTSRKSPARAATAAKTRRVSTAAATRAPSKRTVAKKSAGKAASRKVAPASKRSSKPAKPAAQKTKRPDKAAKVAKTTRAAREAPAVAQRQGTPRQQNPLSAEARKKLAGEHLRALLDEKKRRAAQTPTWQTITHHDHAARLPDALPHGVPSGAPIDRVAGDRDEDN